LTEALELHDVYLAFHEHPSQQLCERLTRALSGPALLEAETASSRDGRTVMFEWALGAEWALGGADVELLEPDLLLKTPDRGRRDFSVYLNVFPVNCPNLIPSHC
jgi:hypothetical protein